MEVGRMSAQARKEAEFLFDESIIAKPLAPAGIECVVSKNPNLYLKWVNCSFNGGAMYEVAKAKGYVNALPVDVEVPGLLFRDGAFRHSDIILMKIDRKLALGAIKAATLRAMSQSGTKQDEASVKQHLKESLNEVGGPRELKNKIQAFTPDAKQLDALTK